MTSTVVRPDIMPMAVEPTAIDGLLRITPKVVTDERGTVRSFSERAATAQPVSVPTAGGRSTSPGRSAARGSPTFGLVVAERLTPGVQVFVPAGVCNGFQAVSDPGCQYLYCFGAEWQPGMPGVAINPLDRELRIAWPIAPEPGNPAMVSAKGASAPRFADL